MKSSIRLKYGMKLAELMKRPDEFVALVKIAFAQDEETGEAILETTKEEDEAISNLILNGLVLKTEKGYRLADKSVINITLRRNPKEQEELKQTRMSDVKTSKIPKELLEYYKIAESFRTMFKDNLTSLKIRTKNIDEATFDKWVTPIRLMMQNDGVTIEQFREVWKFLKGHKFWSDKVQSTQKLRDKFETIHGQARSKKNRKPEAGSTGTGNVSTEYANKVLRDLQSD